MSSEFLRAADVAKLLGIHINTVKKLPDLPFYTVNARGDRRYRREDVEVWLLSRRTTMEQHQ